ncbi:MAG: carboxypeptidase regulatory-like domain-containing protein, partial [Planctomycetota bacterium]
DARVIAVAIGGKRGRGLDRAEARTDAEGRYRLDSLIPGVRYFVEASATGFAPAGQLGRPEGIDLLDFSLLESGRVEGRILDAVTGEGLPDANVMIVAGAATRMSPLSTVTDAEGRYAFPAVSVGPVLLFAADAPGHPSDSWTLGGKEAYKVEAGRVTVIDRLLEPGVVLQGRVSDRRGLPVPYATLALAAARRRAEDELTALTAADGTYRVEGLRAGATYEVRLQAPGFAPLVEDDDARLEVPEASGPLERDFVLAPGAALEGTVRDPEGSTVAGARIEVTARGGRRMQARVQDLAAVSGAGGAWRILGVPPRVDLVVVVQHDAWARGHSPAFNLKPGETRRLDLVLGRGARLAGRVLDEAGDAVAGARVRWGAVGDEDARRYRDAFPADQLLGPRVVRSSDGGAFLIERLEPGRMLLKVEHAGFADWYRKDLVVPAEGDLPDVRVVLHGAGTIEGRVTEARTGRPVAGAWIYAREEKVEGGGPEGAPAEPPAADPGRVRALSSAQTGPDGRYVLDRLPDGRYEVVAWLAVGYRAAVQDRREAAFKREGVEPGTQGVDFQLNPDLPEPP